MNQWPLVDPSPDEDLPSDVALGSWLLSLTPATVLLDCEAGISGAERPLLAYARQKALRSQPS